MTCNYCGASFRNRSPDSMELERETGIEPATNGLGSRYSTIELLPPAEAVSSRIPELNFRIVALLQPTIAPCLTKSSFSLDYPLRHSFSK